MGSVSEGLSQHFAQAGEEPVDCVQVFWRHQQFLSDEGVDKFQNDRIHSERPDLQPSLNVTRVGLNCCDER